MKTTERRDLRSAAEWWKTHRLLQEMFRKGEWYRVQDREVSTWSKSMQMETSNGRRN